MGSNEGAAALAEKRTFLVPVDKSQVTFLLLAHDCDLEPRALAIETKAIRTVIWCQRGRNHHAAVDLGGDCLFVRLLSA